MKIISYFGIIRMSNIFHIYAKAIALCCFKKWYTNFKHIVRHLSRTHTIQRILSEVL